MKVVLAALALASGAMVQAPAHAQQASTAKPAFHIMSSADYAAKPTGSIIDVREPAEWAETGIPAGAATISISRTDFVDEVAKQMGGDRSKPVALMCRSGMRAARAAEALSAAGFTNVTSISDGMLGREGAGPGWIAGKFPTQPYAASKPR